MTVDLRGKGGSVSMGSANWRVCLEIAHKYGWEPKGTRAPDHVIGDPAQWDGGYGTNDFQMVTDDDARAIAEALRRGIVVGEDNDNIIENLAGFAEQGAFYIG
jgi:hypothetical protein